MTPKESAKRESQPRRNPDKRSGPDRTMAPQALAERVLRDLRRLCQRLLADAGRDPDPDELEALEARLRVELGGKSVQKRIRAGGRELIDQLRTQVLELTDGAGRDTAHGLYCYRCGGWTCEHVLPPSPQDVFGGYDATGRPQWVSFSTICAEHRPDQVELLFRDPPAIVAVVLDSPKLKGDQLAAFGRGSRIYDIRGQVCAGLLRGRAPRGATAERHALTLQVVRIRQKTGGVTTALRVLTAGGTASDPFASFDDRDAATLTDLVRQARFRLEQDDARGRRGRATTGDNAERRSSFLTWLARGLEHVYRQQKRRTRHAQERADDSKRPTQKSLEDARAVARDRLHVDIESDTFVVLGPRGRVHVYTLAGIQVTSLVMASDAVRRRVAEGRWRPAETREWNAFQTVIRES